MSNYLVPALITVLSLSSMSLMNATLANTTTNPQTNLVAQKPNCNNPQTQADMNICAGLAYRNSDQNLNQVYKQLLSKLPKSRQQKLISAQQDWIKFRDANCEFEKSEFEGGTIAPTIQGRCLETLTKQRTQQLQGYLKSNL
jgi:uncharacterized protein YecT (DUF1311 family)